MPFTDAVFKLDFAQSNVGGAPLHPGAANGMLSNSAFVINPLKRLLRIKVMRKKSSAAEFSKHNGKISIYFTVNLSSILAYFSAFYPYFNVHY